MSWQDDEVLQAAPAPQASGFNPQQSRAASWQDDEVLSPAPAGQGFQPAAQAMGTQAGTQEIAQTAPTQESAPQAATAPQERGFFGELGRQVGLTARHGLEGLGQAAEIVTEPIRQLVTDPASRAIGLEGQSKPMGQVASQFADTLGLPKPETAQERIVGDASRFVAGSGLVTGGAQMAAQGAQRAGQAMQAVQGPMQAAVQAVAANPGIQAAGAAGAGGASGWAREEGGDGLAQGAAGVVGGLAAGLTAGGMARGAQRLASTMQVSDERLAQSLGRAGIDLDGLSADVQNRLRAQARAAMEKGQLDADAMARLADFERVGATPTRGTLTLDPVQITREQNLARTGANASDTGLHGLARVQHDNNRALIDAVNKLGADAPTDAYATGARVMDTLERGLNAEKTRVGQLYQQARDSAGRSLPLDGRAFTVQASKLLDDGLLGGALPPSVEQHLNRIARGEVPFTVDYAEQLKTVMGQLQRASSDGQTRMAIGMVRKALDETPLMPSAQAEAGRQALSAFNRARLAHKTMMQRVEAIPGLKAVYEGKASADDFVQKHVISRSAKVQDTARLAAELKRSDPETLESVRASLAQHLKTAALGSASDEVGRFSAKGYNKARLALGERKLSQFFSKEEMAQLKAIGNVAQYTTAQPAGSAVNNSNSGAMLAGKGLDLLNRLTAKVPLLGVGPTVSSAVQGVQQRQAMQIGKALTNTAPQAPHLPNATQGALLLGAEQVP